jgi:hypothetical protein
VQHPVISLIAIAISMRFSTLFILAASLAVVGAAIYFVTASACEIYLGVPWEAQIQVAETYKPSDKQPNP